MPIIEPVEGQTIISRSDGHLIAELVGPFAGPYNFRINEDICISADVVEIDKNDVFLRDCNGGFICKIWDAVIS